MYDVIIVGAGAAGASAAYYLGTSGLRVLVIDKQTIPRYKACGGGLSLQFLKKYFPFSFEPVIERFVKQISYSYCGKQSSIPINDGIMGMVMRDRFDAFILSHAICELRQGLSISKVIENSSHVVVETQHGEKLACRYLIGADGVNSIVRKSLNMPHRCKLIPALEAEVPLNKHNYRYIDGPTFIFEGPRNGYLWIFPKADHLSIGIANLKPRNLNLLREMTQFMKKKGISLDGLKIHGHPIPLYRPGNHINSKRTVLTGDAAGLVDPLSGEGIRPAIKSGILAAQAIISENLDNYPVWVRQQLGIKLYKSLIVSKVFYPLREICLLLGAPNPISTHTVLQALSDHGSYLRVLAFSILSLPYFFPIELLAIITRSIAGDKQANRIRSYLLPGDY